MPIGPLSQPGGSARTPDAPTGVSASAVSGGQASIAFTASTNPGKPSGNYVATASPGPITGSAASSPISITGLTIGTAYTFTVVKQSGSGISSVSSSVSNSIGAYAAPIFGTQTGTSTAIDPSTSTTSVSSVSTTTATLASSIGANGTFWNYERVTGSGGTSPTTSTSLTGLAEKTAHTWRVNSYNTSSNQSLITRVTPNGSSCTVAVEYGDTTGYGNTASVSSGLANIGSGTTEVSTTWSLGSSTKGNYGSTNLDKTIYYRITVTYFGGATTQQTGTIVRTINLYNGNPTISFTTYGTYTYTNDTGSMSVTKPSTHVNITNISVTLAGAGGGSGSTSPYLGYGGGGGGNIITASSLTHTSGNMTIQRGAGGGPGGSGGTTEFVYSGGGYYSEGGESGSFNSQGGTSGNGNSGDNGDGGSGGLGGGGGGYAGASTDINGGSGDTSLQWGAGGPGYYDFGGGFAGWGVYIYGSEGQIGAGGKGRGGSGANGYFSISYIGPARN